MSKALSVYYKAFETQIAEIEKAVQSGSAKPRLLLHACCGPCSSAVLEVLVKHFEITILYYNPNIYPEAEYMRRKDELCRFLPAFLKEKAPRVIELAYDPQDFYEAVKSVDGFETMPEKGERCRVCYRLRLMRCAEEAFTRHFD
ncbi:MAG: epoxyqueuosine reductase QueH, partial [Spirochaetaceae bacterium]|nr:epoxyqueuosine reductase QueH [Spirochaetaceae bacterium]